ncbi:MAG TPA: glycoside hydrolase family 47 protein [Gammaproteobacteria bacterium]
MKAKLLLVATLLLLPGIIYADAAAPEDPAITAARVKTEFLHAWDDYVKYAWGHDELMPLSKKPKDWYGQSLLMTPVDALDTLVIMGLKDQADKDRELIDTQLNFDKDIYVKNFEITIRLLGGLLSSYELTHDPKLLALAKDLGTRLLPAFDSPTGMPYQFVNLRTGKTRGAESNPAETGTLILEFGTLSKLTGDPQFYAKAKRALIETFKRRSAIGLVGDGINVETGQWTSKDSHISGGIDSYYEYLWKCSVLFADPDCIKMWQATIPTVDKYLPDEVDGRLWYGHVDMDTGKRTATEYGALDAFFPGLLAFSGDISRARRLQDSGYYMWDLNHMEPEVYDYKNKKVEYPGYELRPEMVESTYYLWHLTRDPVYQDHARSMFADFVKYCRNDVGYTALKSVVTKEKKDDMESFVFAETFKYFYLIFAPPSTLDFDSIVFNTEAHPLLRTPPKPQ